MKNQGPLISFQEACRAAETLDRYFGQPMTADAANSPEDLHFTRSEARNAIYQWLDLEARVLWDSDDGEAAA